jgi:hypothetical protein
MNAAAINTLFRLQWAALREAALALTLLAGSPLAILQERGAASPAATEQGAGQPELRSVVRFGITVGDRGAVCSDFSGRCCGYQSGGGTQGA